MGWKWLEVRHRELNKWEPLHLLYKPGHTILELVREVNDGKNPDYSNLASPGLILYINTIYPDDKTDFLAQNNSVFDSVMKKRRPWLYGERRLFGYRILDRLPDYRFSLSKECVAQIPSVSLKELEYERERYLQCFYDKRYHAHAVKLKGLSVKELEAMAEGFGKRFGSPTLLVVDARSGRVRLGLSRESERFCSD